MTSLVTKTKLLNDIRTRITEMCTVSCKCTFFTNHGMMFLSGSNKHIYQCDFPFPKTEEEVDIRRQAVHLINQGYLWKESYEKKIETVNDVDLVTTRRCNTVPQQIQKFHALIVNQATVSSNPADQHLLATAISLAVDESHDKDSLSRYYTDNVVYFSSVGNNKQCLSLFKTLMELYEIYGQLVFAELVLVMLHKLYILRMDKNVQFVASDCLLSVLAHDKFGATSNNDVCLFILNRMSVIQSWRDLVKKLMMALSFVQTANRRDFIDLLRQTVSIVLMTPVQFGNFNEIGTCLKSLVCWCSLKTNDYITELYSEKFGPEEKLPLKNVYTHPEKVLRCVTFFNMLTAIVNGPGTVIEYMKSVCTIDTNTYEEYLINLYRIYYKTYKFLITEFSEIRLHVDKLLGIEVTQQLQLEIRCDYWPDTRQAAAIAAAISAGVNYVVYEEEEEEEEEDEEDEDEEVVKKYYDGRRKEKEKKEERKTTKL
uniref:Uncharacterized protein n=1 Tax=Silurid herpesvirus 2 TaxID=2978071 RepID=A0A977TN98_9VIRU|nr:hypothetical protein [Silurid herpesvirus 2]